MGYEIGVEEVEKLTSEETFDVLEFVQNTNTPEDTVDIYTDADAAKKILQFIQDEKAQAEEREDQWSIADALPSEEKEQISEEELTKLHERLIASKLTFEIKGLAPSALTALDNHLKATTDYKEGGENKEYSKALDNTVVAKSIKSVTNSKGQKSNTEWTPEKVEAFLVNIYPSEQAKLFGKVGDVNYVGGIFDEAVNADFS